MFNYFKFNGFSNGEKKVIVTKDIVIPITQENVESQSREGNGSVTTKLGTYNDKIFEMELAIEANSIDDVIDVEDWLTDIKDDRFILNSRPNRCYKIKRIIIEPVLYKPYWVSEFKVKVICDPFVYPITESYFTLGNATKVNYIGNVPGEPIIKIKGNGNIQLTVNGDTLTIRDVVDEVEIDSKNGQVTSKGVDKIKDTIGDFTLLIPGWNNISLTGTYNEVKILPRTKWRN